MTYPINFAAKIERSRQIYRYESDDLKQGKCKIVKTKKSWLKPTEDIMVCLTKKNQPQIFYL